MCSYGTWPISLLSVGLSLRIFTEDRSYQYLQDAILFGLLSDKSTEILKWKYSKKLEFSILAAFCTEFPDIQMRQVTSQPHLHTKKLCVSQYGEMAKFVNSPFNFSALLSDNKPNEVASFSY